MKKLLLTISSCALLLLTQGCEKKQEGEGKLISIKLSELTTPDSLKNFDLYEIVDVVPLETSDRSIFGDVEQTVTIDSIIYVRATFSAQSIDAGVWQFDNKGKLIRQLGGVGEGPGEYHSISNIILRNDTLFAFDNWNANVHLYQASTGDYLTSSVIGGFKPLGSANTVIDIPGSSDFLISSNVIFGKDPYGIGEGNPFTGKFDVIETQRFKVSKYRSYKWAFPSLSHLDEYEALAVLPLNDTIYSVNYKSRRLKPFAVLEWEKPTLSFSKGEEFETAQKKAKELNFNQFYNFYAGSKYLIVNRLLDSIIWNLENGEGWKTNGSWFEPKEGMPICPGEIVDARHDNIFTCSYNAELFKQFVLPKLDDQLVKAKLEDCPDLDPESNDILVFYKFK